jgi:hypothetical protein
VTCFASGCSASVGAVPVTSSYPDEVVREEDNRTVNLA